MPKETLGEKYRKIRTKQKLGVYPSFDLQKALLTTGLILNILYIKRMIKGGK